ALAGDGKTELGSGQLQTLDNAIDPSTGTIKLKAVFANAQDRLWPGLFVNAKLLVATERNALTVPSVAVLHGPSGLYVYLVKPDSLAAHQTVTVAADDGRVAVIVGGLPDEATVVTQGQSRLQDGTGVATTRAEPQPAANGST
ncbi:MAG: efflux RND transporter periplasmic adaptor subunit, partial [Pseudomonadota bacterium]|nr:efflux RND transporter periplasmic adaptor subunit [Pseudomonadota bacterium]